MPVLLLSLDEDEVSRDEILEIERILPDYDLVITRDKAEIENLIDEVEIVAGQIPVGQIIHGPVLRWIQTWSAGTDWLYHYPEVIERDLTITNGSGIHAVPISEHILAFLFAFARQLPLAFQAQKTRQWSYPGKGETSELFEKTVVLVGVGAIGARTAELLTALGMRVLGVRRHPDKTVPGVEKMYSQKQLIKILPQADFVVITTPLTPETREMIGEPELRAMKDSAILINIGRGATIQEDKLIQALQEGWIAGAGLDTFAREPLPEDSPLWGMDNVIMTNHYSGTTPQYHKRAMAIFLTNLKHYAAGENMINVVDKELGY